MYGCRGFVCHHNTDAKCDTAPQDVWIPATFWVMGAAWLSTHIWEHYCYTLNKQFLVRYYHILKEAALFFEDFLVEHDGYLVTCPSVSPENTFILPNGEKGANIYGVTMDNQILRDLFTICLNCAEILGGEAKEYTDKLHEMLDKLIPTKIASDGTIMEWPEEYEELEPGHRHISHLYGLHPSSQITMDGTQSSPRQPEKHWRNALLTAVVIQAGAVLGLLITMQSSGTANQLIRIYWLFLQAQLIRICLISTLHSR